MIDDRELEAQIRARDANREPYPYDLQSERDVSTLLRLLDEAREEIERLQE